MVSRPEVSGTRGPASRTTRADSRPDNRADAGRPEETLSKSLLRVWRVLKTRVPRIRKDVSLYANLQVDRVRTAAASVVLKAITAVLMLIIVAAVLATGSTLVVLGIAGGLTTLLDGQAWLAYLITGLGTIGGLVLVFMLLAAHQKSKRMRALKRRYAPEPDDPQEAATLASKDPHPNDLNTKASVEHRNGH